MSDDIDQLIARLHPAAPWAGNLPQGFLAPDRPVVIARAPGRLDVMGGIADYSGSLVLQLPLALPVSFPWTARQSRSCCAATMRPPAVV